MDLSFISLKLVVPKVKEFLCPDGRIIALIKPQFEVGKGRVGKGGIVKDQALHVEVMGDLTHFFSNNGFKVSPIIPSPIQGAKGNLEFLVLLSSLL